MYQAKDPPLGNSALEMSELLSHVPRGAVLRTESHSHPVSLPFSSIHEQRRGGLDFRVPCTAQLGA